jgi:hypothetical protein
MPAMTVLPATVDDAYNAVDPEAPLRDGEDDPLTQHISRVTFHASRITNHKEDL